MADKVKNPLVRTDFVEEGEPDYARIPGGRVRCDVFPLVILTSNGEREFPPPFLRRCIRLTMPAPNDRIRLRKIIRAHLGDSVMADAEALITKFLKNRETVQTKGEVATDQLLNAVYMLVREQAPEGTDRERLQDSLLKHLSSVFDI